MVINIAPKETYTHKQKKKGMFLMGYGLFLLFLALGITTYILVSSKMNHMSILIAGGGLFIIYFLLKNFLKEQDQDVMHLQQGEEGENLANETLKNLPPEYVNFVDNTFINTLGNIDNIVVGPTGVFALEVKNITPSKYYWNKHIPWFYYQKIVGQTYREAMDVNRFLKSHNVSNNFVVPVLVLTHPGYQSKTQFKKYQGVWVVPLHLLNQFITSHKQGNLNWSDANKICEALNTGRIVN